MKPAKPPIQALVLNTAAAMSAYFAHDGLFWRRMAAFGAQRFPSWWVRYTPPVFGARRRGRASSCAPRGAEQPPAHSRPAAALARRRSTRRRRSPSYAGCLAETLADGLEERRAPRRRHRRPPRTCTAALAKSAASSCSRCTRAAGRSRDRCSRRTSQARRDARDGRRAQRRRAPDPRSRARVAGVRVIHIGGDPLAALPLVRHLTETKGAAAMQVDRVPSSGRVLRVRLLGQRRLAARRALPSRAAHGRAVSARILRAPRLSQIRLRSARRADAPAPRERRPRVDAGRADASPTRCTRFLCAPIRERQWSRRGHGSRTRLAHDHPIPHRREAPREQPRVVREALRLPRSAHAARTAEPAPDPRDAPPLAQAGPPALRLLRRRGPRGRGAQGRPGARSRSRRGARRGRRAPGALHVARDASDRDPRRRVARSPREGRRAPQARRHVHRVGAARRLGGRRRAKARAASSTCSSSSTRCAIPRRKGPVFYGRLRALGETRSFGTAALERVVEAIGVRRDAYVVIETQSALAECKRLRQLAQVRRKVGGHGARRSPARRRRRRARRVAARERRRAGVTRRDDPQVGCRRDAIRRRRRGERGARARKRGRRVCAAVLAAAALDAGVLFGPRARPRRGARLRRALHRRSPCASPAAGAPRPRGFLSEEEVPLGARVAVPALPAAIATAHDDVRHRHAARVVGARPRAPRAQAPAPRLARRPRRARAPPRSAKTPSRTRSSRPAAASRAAC